MRTAVFTGVIYGTYVLLTNERNKCGKIDQAMTVALRYELEYTAGAARSTSCRTVQNTLNFARRNRKAYPGSISY